ncbi:HAD-IB family hydrolase [Shewanella youngdeokensis]|uniref:HAD-IB family hydrolase n=1 Tax=Shewanella youngdeokensis TaxID=2999068 RepID=A0ABZ0JVT6_9GAMM|nr:HAD-IB family hydrolase [Shewanella sp. DAU334]
MNLALFDFDGTLTRHDMYTRFVIYSASPLRLVLGGIMLSPLFLLYKLKLIPARKLRPLVSYFAFAGRDKKTVAAIGRKFAGSIIQHSIRPEMLETLLNHKANGDRVVLVSASLDIYLRPWCESIGIGLICSEMSVKRGQYTGRYVAGDCNSELKASLVQASYPLDDFDEVFAYGDTNEDLAMLAIADYAYMNGVKV